MFILEDLRLTMDGKKRANEKTWNAVRQRSDGGTMTKIEEEKKRTEEEKEN